MSLCSPPQVLPVLHLTGGLSPFHQLPISLKEILKQLGVKSDEAGVGAVVLGEILSQIGEILSQILSQIRAGRFYSSSAEKLWRKLRRLPRLQAPRAPRGAGITEPPGIIKKSSCLYTLTFP